MKTTKQTLLKQIQELEQEIQELKQENQQYRFALVYSLFDIEATRRERNQALAELRLLREALLDAFEGSEGENERVQ